MKNSGFTYFELLLVVALIAILGALSSPFLSRSLSQNHLEETTNKLVRSLRKGQNYSLTGKQDSAWGVHYGDEKIILFKGEFYGQDHSFDESCQVPRTIKITGWSDVIFSQVRGQPSTILSLIISSNSGSRTVTLNQEGGINVE